MDILNANHLALINLIENSKLKFYHLFFLYRIDLIINLIKLDFNHNVDHPVLFTDYQ